MEGLSAWSSHNANDASNLCELVTEDFTLTQLQITNYVTSRTPISHNTTLDRCLGWAATICFTNMTLTLVQVSIGITVESSNTSRVDEH